MCITCTIGGCQGQTISSREKESTTDSDGYVFSSLARPGRVTLICSRGVTVGLPVIYRSPAEQLDAVLAAVKAWPGQAGDVARRERRPSLTAASVPIAIVRKHLRHTLGERSESKGHWQLYGSSAPLNPKFAIGLAARVCKLRVRGTRARRRGYGRSGRRNGLRSNKETGRVATHFLPPTEDSGRQRVLRMSGNPPSGESYSPRYLSAIWIPSSYIF